MSRITDPYLVNLFPTEEKLIPQHNTTRPDEWVIANPLTANNTFFRTQWVECQYPISGGYALTPRIVFYILVVASIIGRGKKWAVGAALGAVMIYSSTAAIHALILAGIRHLLAPKWLFPDYQVVLVEGQSTDGYFSNVDTSQRNAPLWLPIIPMAWDNDSDPVLLITAVSFLLLLPMHNWSKTLQNAEKNYPEHSVVIVSWAVLLFAGLIAALVNQAYTYFWSFPQLRFCPLDRADNLPLQYNGAPSVVGEWDRHDWYLWNRTVYNYFVTKKSTIQPTNACLYTCFDTKWPLRDPTDIQVVPGNVGVLFETNTMLRFLISIYVLVGCSTAGCITLAILKQMPGIPDNWRNFGLGDTWNDTVEEVKTGLDILASRTYKRRRKIVSILGRVLVRVWILFMVFYSSILSLAGLVAVVVYYEWEIKTSDPGEESARHIGQWSVAVGATLAFGAVIFPGYVVRWIRGRHEPAVQNLPPREVLSFSSSSL